MLVTNCAYQPERVDEDRKVAVVIHIISEIDKLK